MARLLVLTVFFCALSLTAVAQEREDVVVGEARDKIPYDLREMCTQSYGRYFNRMLQRPSLFIGWVRELVRYPVATRVGRYFYSRPHDTPRSSICAPMNTTCCKRLTEKHIARATVKEYGELFLNVTSENIGTCFTIGRHFYHAVYSNFKEIRRQLEIPVKILLDDKMPEDLFDNFFTYLSSFSVTSDLCDLPLHLTAIMSRVFDFIHDAQSGVSLRDVRTECYLNVSVQLMSETYERLFAGLERQLYNLDLIFRAMKISEFTLQRLKEHRFSAECTKPLTQLYNCGQCTGYFTFKPCLFYCMNVLRGCFSDVADIHKDFRLMTKALSDVPDSILGTFQPEVFIKDSLTHFVNLVGDLKERNLKSEITSACTSERVTVRRRRSGYSRRQSPAYPTTSSSSQEVDRLATAFNAELQCMEKIGTLLGNIPEQMCYQSKEYETIADTGNHRCWLGSKMGTYYHQQVQFTKEDQVGNPEFRGGTRPPYLDQFTDLCMEISMITAEINETLDLDLCLDDEDCTTAPFYLCGVEDPASGSGSGSGDFRLKTKNGSGSGSGLGSGGTTDDGMRDMEEGDSDATDEESSPTLTHNETAHNRPPNATDPDEILRDGEDGYTVYDIDSNKTANNTDSTPSVATPTDEHSGSEVVVELNTDPRVEAFSSALQFHSSIPLSLSALAALLLLSNT